MLVLNLAKLQMILVLCLGEYLPRNSSSDHQEWLLCSISVSPYLIFPHSVPPLKLHVFPSKDSAPVFWFVSVLLRDLARIFGLGGPILAEV